MKFKTAVFALSCQDLATCPGWRLPEFAFIGRSNVGKSSLINLLAGKDGLAKVSAVPGKTRLINFFVMDETWSLVDLPGYGYARVAREEKLDFNEAVGDYLEKRPNLSLVFILIDSRIPPQQLDLDFIQWLSGCRVPFAIVFTKTDKQKATRTRSNVEEFRRSLAKIPSASPEILLSSSKDRTGRREILEAIQRHI